LTELLAKQQDADGVVAKAKTATNMKFKPFNMVALIALFTCLTAGTAGGLNINFLKEAEILTRPGSGFCIALTMLS